MIHRDGPVLLAAYGTLMTGQPNTLRRDIRARMISRGACLIGGRIYAVRQAVAGCVLTYPGLVLPRDPADRPVVHAEAFAIGADAAEAAAVLRATDAYEDCLPNDPRRSVFRRVRLPIRLLGRCPGEGAWGGAPCCDEAWVYVYNRPIAGARPIPGGRWAPRSRSVHTVNY